MLSKLQKFKDEFEKTDLWKDMVNTIEGSPWHREANVAIHTNMTIDYFLDNFAEHRNELEQVIVFIALLFHDTGKPSAKEVKFSKERGKYFRFSGHELISTRIWEDYFCCHQNTLLALGINHDIAFKIGWIIQNHLPFDVKKQAKRIAFAKSLKTIFNETSGLSHNCFYDHLSSDNNGRISDDHNEKRRNLNEWISEHKLLVSTTQLDIIDHTKPIVYILIGASGTGKSTYAKKYLNTPWCHSMDQIRLDMYEKIRTDDVNIYENAFLYSINEGKKEFSKNKTSDFINKLSTGDNVTVDNTNTSKRSRLFYVDEARRKGYNVIAVLFPISKQELSNRQVSRTDKKVSTEVSFDQYRRLTLPNIGSEVDDIIIVE